MSFVLGITEVQIIQWYVEEGAHVEEWKPLCQYQSDKAVDDVYSVFTRLLEYEELTFKDYIEICRGNQEAPLSDRRYGANRTSKFS